VLAEINPCMPDVILIPLSHVQLIESRISPSLLTSSIAATGITSSAAKASGHQAVVIYATHHHVNLPSRRTGASHIRTYGEHPLAHPENATQRHATVDPIQTPQRRSSLSMARAPSCDIAASSRAGEQLACSLSPPRNRNLH
jgi:hypothetical protein